MVMTSYRGGKRIWRRYLSMDHGDHDRLKNDSDQIRSIEARSGGWEHPCTCSRPDAFLESIAVVSFAFAVLEAAVDEEAGESV